MIRFSTFPRTSPPPAWVKQVVQTFTSSQDSIATTEKRNALNSDQVLQVLRKDLEGIGFQVEASKRRADKIERPVFFGENGLPEVRYEIDAYHAGWRCGLEVEAGRGWLGNAVYRDLILAALMVDVDFLIIAVANEYWSMTGGRPVVSKDYDYARRLADTIFSHRRLQLPYGLAIIGY